MATQKEINEQMVEFINAQKVQKDEKFEKLIEENKVLKAEIEALKLTKVRNRGPKSKRKMTSDDANRVLSGDLKDTPHREAAEILELSYGQIYSCRHNHTFRKISR